MTLVTLLTDFGICDEYVGVMKGVIAGIDPNVRTVDISHHIAPQDVVHGAFVLAAAYAYFPAGTVHLAVVDPGVGTARRILAVECGAHRFVAPDNGLLERVLTDQPADRVVSVVNRCYSLKRVGCTFHGRDVFAPVAAHLAAGVPLTRLGPVVDRRSVVAGVVPQCRLSAEYGLEGIVVAVDRFGNLMTNIDAEAIESLKGRIGGRPLIVELSGRPIGGLVDTYDRVPWHAPLALVGSRGLLEISVNGGDARRTLDAGKNDPVRVRPG